MSGWSDDELRRVGDATELQLSSRRSDGSLRPYVTMWVVRVGDALFVRSAYGPGNPWYRRAMASGSGRIRAAGVDADVTFGDARNDAQAAIDAAYHAKYDSYGASIVGIVGPDAHPVTVRLLRRVGRSAS